MLPIPEQCGTCIRFGDIKGVGDEVFVCKAYPDGIPEEVQDGSVKHNKVLNGQTGDYTFQTKEDLS